jgi:hypothetical protein
MQEASGSVTGTIKKELLQLAPVAQAYNPSYSGGRDQEDWGMKPAQANSSWDVPLSRKNPLQKKTGGVAQGVGPEFKPQYCKKKIRYIRIINDSQIIL